MLPQLLKDLHILRYQRQYQRNQRCFHVQDFCLQITLVLIDVFYALLDCLVQRLPNGDLQRLLIVLIQLERVVEKERELLLVLEVLVVA